jgi:hypothetical protein
MTWEGGPDGGDYFGDVLGDSMRGMPSIEDGCRNPFTMAAVAALSYAGAAEVEDHPSWKDIPEGWLVIQAPLPRDGSNPWLGMAVSRAEAIKAGKQAGCFTRSLSLTCGVRSDSGFLAVHS